MIRNLIFDLGEVLLDLNWEGTADAFERLGFKDFRQKFDADTVSKIFQDLEVGKISDEEFCDALRQANNLPDVSNDDIYNTWNTILASFYENRIQFVRSLKNDYRLFLLSNTNHIHAVKFEEMYRLQFPGEELKDLFEKVYYSHDMGLRKPNAEIYEEVLKQQHLHANETLFIDDNEMNILSANTLDIHTHHLPRKSSDTILDNKELWRNALLACVSSD